MTEKFYPNSDLSEDQMKELAYYIVKLIKKKSKEENKYRNTTHIIRDNWDNK